MPRKKKADKSEIGKEEKRKKNSHEQQLKWVFIVMGIMIIIAIGVYLFVDSLEKFEYGGLHFEEIMFDKLNLYHAKLSMSYGGKQILYNLFLRNDPRELRDIPVEGKIILDKSVSVSIDPSVETGCDDSSIAGANLGNLLRGAGLNLDCGYLNPIYAKERNASYITCSDSVSGSVITIQRGEENSVRTEKEYCYVITYKDCDIMKVVERFEVAAIANSKGISV